MIKIKNNKSYIFFIILSCLLIILSYTFFNDETQAVVTLELDGSGLENDPYKIYNYEDLINFSDYVNSGGATYNKYFELKNNLNLLSSFVPIGTRTYSFRGHFNGNFCSISNLNLNNTNVSGSLGFFAYTSNATIENLIALSGSINLTDLNSSAGSIVGESLSNTKINYCFNNGVNITSNNGGPVGGIIGKSYGTISNCANYGTINSRSTKAIAGGIAGQSSLITTINESFNNGSITAIGTNNEEFSIAGGIVGSGNSARVNNSYNRGNVTANNIPYNVSEEQNYARMQLFEAGSLISIRENRRPRVTKAIRAIAGGIIGQYGSASNCYNTAYIKGGYTQTTYNLNYIFYCYDFSYPGYQFDNFSTTICMQAVNLVGTITGASGSWSNCFSNALTSNTYMPAETISGTTLRPKRTVNLALITYTYEVRFFYNSTRGHYTIDFLSSWIENIDKDRGSGGASREPFNKPTPINVKNCTENISLEKLGNSFARNPLINNGYPYIKNMFWLNAQEPFN